jgi:hypothetical protein
MLARPGQVLYSDWRPEWGLSAAILLGPSGGRFRGMADDIAYLPPKERAKRYYHLALGAAREAEKTTGAMRKSYLIIAEQFRELAKAAEAEAAARGN